MRYLADGDGLTEMQKAAAERMIAGDSATEAARKAGYRDPRDAGKALRRSDSFTDYVMAHMRGKIVRYHEMLELSKQNIIYLLGTDETDDRVRAHLALGVLKVLAKSGKDGKTLIERAMDEDKVEADPRTIAARLLSAAVPAPPLPGEPDVIDVVPETVR
jgi:phage terminase small subunit